MSKLLKSLFVFLLVFSAVSYSADERPSSYLGLRPAAMGGAFSAISDDENAFFYNPAGLADVTVSKFVLLNPSFKLGEELQNLLDMIKDVDDAKNDAVEQTKKLTKYIGLSNRSGFSLFPYYVTKNFGVGVLGKVDTIVEVKGPTNLPKVNIDRHLDITYIGTYAMKFEEIEGLSIGGSVKIINRDKLIERETGEIPVSLGVIDLAGAEVEMDLAKLSIDIGNKIDSVSATGVAIDAGAIYQLDEKTKLALVLKNIGGAKFDFKYTTTTGKTVDYEGEIPFGMTIGASYKYELPEKYKESLSAKDILLAADIADIGAGGSFWKKVHLGAETAILRKINVRTGINQGYLTFGLGYRLGIFQLDYAYYQEERGRYAGQLVDKSHLMNLTLRF